MSRKDARYEMMRAAKARRRRWFGLVGGTAIVLGLCWGVKYQWPAETASAQVTPATAVASAERDLTSPASVVAEVNGKPIQRRELAAECLNHFGNDVLESLVNKHLILQHCNERGITVSAEDVDAEIERMAGRFNLPVQQWLEMLRNERNITDEQYRRDIIWPTLALRKLAQDRLQISEKELQEAFESEYGQRVKVRMIGVLDQTVDGKTGKQRIEEVYELAKAEPQDFGRLAKQYSEDPESASVNGWIPPVRRHVGEPAIEKAAFSLKTGELSPIVQLNDRFLFMMCEGYVRAQNVSLDLVRGQLEELITDRKLRTEATTLFAKLQNDAKVVNVYGSAELSKQMPGIAATINGRKIPLDYLAEECMARNGAEAIGGLINRRLLEQALGRRGLKVTQKEIDAEIEEAAMKMRPPKNGQVDVEGWIQQVTSEPGVTKELYIRDAVWPSVALKLLVSEGIKVTEEDLKKAWEANYGPRVRCKAIVVDDLRTAKKVWQLARDNAGEENFGNLSEEYSSDASVRALKGDVPPIQLHSGRPNLEKEAFNLREGEMSGVIQADDKFVILLCTGWTEPQNLEMEAVRNLLFNHVHAQKLRRAMADEFQRLQSTAKIVNYLSPKPSARTAAYPDPRAVR